MEIPVYLGEEREPRVLYVGNPMLKLAGVMESFFADVESQTNVGIAAVIPAHELYEILHSDELKLIRDF